MEYSGAFGLQQKELEGVIHGVVVARTLYPEPFVNCKKMTARGQSLIDLYTYQLF